MADKGREVAFDAEGAAGSSRWHSGRPESRSSTMTMTRRQRGMSRRMAPQQTAPTPSKPKVPGQNRMDLFRPDPVDSQAPHRVKGQLQPSVGERLTHLLNFLADEDVDRCEEWESNMAEAREYIDFLNRQSVKATLGDKTIEMLDEARRRVQAHDIFAKHTTERPAMDRWVRRAHMVPPPVEPRLRPATTERRAASATAATPALPPLTAGARQDVPQLLQSCLRQLGNEENKNKAARTLWHRVVPPVEPALRKKQRKAAASIQFSALAVPREEAEKAPGADTMPYTRKLRTYWLNFDDWWEQAGVHAERDNDGEGGGDWGTLPDRRLPWIDRDMPAAVRQRRDLLRSCQTVAALLERAVRVAPRDLIRQCREMMHQAREDKRLNQAPPAKLLRPVDWEQAEQGGLDGRKRATNAAGRRRIRLLNETELNFVRLLSTGSANKRMLRRLSNRSSLYLVFADRLQRALDDLSEDNIFATADTAVTVEQLLEVMHRGTEGENTRTQFSAHDACCWLDRLDRAGRVRFHVDLISYGVVRRPLTDVHPEHQVRHVPPQHRSTVAGGRRPSTESTEFDEFDSVLAPRPSDLDDWEEVVASGRPWQELRSDVREFFLGLCYRLGHTIQELQHVAASDWEPLPAETTERALAAWEGRFAQWKRVTGMHKSLVEFCADMEAAGLEAWGDRPLDEAQALAQIRRRVIDEAERAAESLYPTQWCTPLATEDGGQALMPQREPIWDWARPEVCGIANRFFSLDRYPLDRQSPATAAAIRSDADFDPAVLWDPCAEDLTEPQWLMQKPRRIGEETAVYRPGPANYVVGDTPLQQRAVETYIHNSLARGMAAAARGAAPSEKTPEKKTIFSRLSGILPALPFSLAPSPAGAADTARPPPVKRWLNTESAADIPPPAKRPRRGAGQSRSRDAQG